MSGAPELDQARIEAALREAVAAALPRVGELIGDASDELAPKDTNELVRSRRVDVEVDGDTARVAVSYSAEHAVFQHEALAWRHPNGGQAKFLETALLASAPKAQKLIAEQIRRALA